MKNSKVVYYIVNWMKEYAQNAGVKGFVVGVSGGIDSALTSTLCAKTELPTLCLEIPIDQNPSQLSMGKEQISYLKSLFHNVNNEHINLTETFEIFKKTVPKTQDKDTLDLAFANTKSRMRMTLLYYFARLKNYLVVGTGNKIEDFGIGFYTKYGDGGVDISPIADLMKSQVYTLAKFLKIPDSIVNSIPTDGLFGDNRSDQDQIGADYEELEWAMKEETKGSNPQEFKGRKKEVFEIFNLRNKANKHKMRPIPVCIIPDKYL